MDSSKRLAVSFSIDKMSFVIRLSWVGSLLTQLSLMTKDIIIISSNDPLNPETLVPVQVTVELPSVVDDIAIPTLPQVFRLSQNYPNPFSPRSGLFRAKNPQTIIVYQLPQAGKVSLKVYNTVGQLVKTVVEAERDSGCHTVFWDGTDDQGHTVASGVYFYRLEAEGQVQTRKLLWLR